MIKIPYKTIKDKQYKWCSNNKHWVILSDFYGNKTTHDGLDNYCKKCKLKYNKNNYKEYLNTERGKEVQKGKSLRYYNKQKNRFFDMYGRVCVCCGETTPEFLTIEHKLGQKGKTKKETGNAAYKKATSEYRPDLYEVLCYNCNFSKGKLGYCPHQKL